MNKEYYLKKVYKLYPELLEMDNTEKYLYSAKHELEEKIRSELLKEILGKKETETTGLFMEYPKEVNFINQLVTEITGLTDNDGNTISINECLEEDTNLLSFKNLLDYKNKYHLSGSFFRLVENNTFIYCFLYTLSEYILDELSDFLFDYTEKRYPNEFVSNPDDGKKVKGGYLWSKRLNAFGKEKQLEYLQRRANNYLINKQNTLEKEYSDEKVFIKDFQYEHAFDEEEKDRAYIFNTDKVLSRITFENFVNDTKKLSNTNNELDKIIDKEKQLFKVFLDSIH